MKSHVFKFLASMIFACLAFCTVLAKRYKDSIVSLVSSSLNTDTDRPEILGNVDGSIFTLAKSIVLRNAYRT